MALSMLSAYWVVSFSLTMTPGADWAYAIAAGLRGRVIVPAIAGMLLGYLTITLVVAAGVGALVASMPAILTALTLAGAGYLLWLGIGILRRPPRPQAGEGGAGAWPAWVARGFAVSGMNPKALLLYLALLPQFLSADAAWPVPAQITAMGAVQMANCAVVYSLVAVGAKLVLRARPRLAHRVGQASGALMIVIALLLLAEQAAVV